MTDAPTTLAAAFEMYATDRRLTSQAARRLRESVASLHRSNGATLSLDAVTAELLNRWMDDQRKRGLSLAAIRCHVQGVLDVLEHARAAGCLADRTERLAYVGRGRKGHVQ